MSLNQSFIYKVYIRHLYHCSQSNENHNKTEMAIGFGFK